MSRIPLPAMPPGYWTAWIATLSFFAAFYTLLVPLPLYLSGIGLPDWQIGVILGAFGIASLIGRPLTGAFSDAWGYRPVMLLGTGLLVVGSVAVSLTTNPALLFVMRLLQAAGYVAFTTAATALVSDLALPQQRGSMLAVFGIAANIAVSIIPAIVSGLLWLITIQGALWLAGILAMAGGLLTLRLPMPPKSDQHNRQNWLKMVQIPAQLHVPLLMAAIFGIGFGAFLQFLPLLAARRDLEPAGLLYTVYGIGIILTRIVTGKLLDSRHRNSLLSLAFLILATGLAGCAVAPSQLVLAISALFIAAGSGILHPGLITMHVERMQPSKRGRATAAFYLGFDLGIGLGTWLLSFALQTNGLEGLYLLAALLTCSGIIVMQLHPRIAVQEA